MNGQPVARTRERALSMLVATLAFVCLGMALTSSAAARQGDGAATPGPQPTADDGRAYPVSAFQLRYVRDNPAHPPLAQILQLETPLGWTSKGYVAPREEFPTVRIALGDAVNRGVEPYYSSALQRILERVRDHLVQHGLMGVYVAPDPMQINESGQDLRPAGQTALTLLITTGIVTELRTLASGERVSPKGPIKPENRVNNPLHQRIRDRSPIQPSQDPQEQRDLLLKDELDRYLFHLSRHPGRRVDASVAAGMEPGSVALDYLVTENRPLVLYAQISNTGTKSTDYWRQRFGLLHSQVTNSDDVFSLDYITSWFDKTNAVVGSYERPLPNDRIRWRVHGNWSQFTADQVGFFGDDFEGESWAIGADIIANIYQQRELFVDLTGGVRFQNVHVDNVGFAITGDEDFIIPSLGLRLDRTTEWFSTQGTLSLEYWMTDATSSELEALGRTAPDEDSPVLQWGVTHAFYLEPLIDREGWADPSTPRNSTLAHEIQLGFRGQYGFERRLIPQAEQVVGGLYSVRGYPESVVAGDTAVVGSLEYRYHLPRALAIEPEPRELFGMPFRYAPQYVFGRPDWDLVLKAFLDAGKVWNSDRLSFERDETLVGVGIGVELLYRRNLNVRLDWGFALEEVEAAQVHSGSNRVHLVATLLF